ncbi:NPD-domain-containing protein [Trametes elegans]|nr:NPD-domain-containing protein [Trametes elegans]
MARTMQGVNTSLTRLLGIRVPVVSAAMAFATSAKLAVEVSQAGGFGFLGAAFATPESLAQDLTAARASFPDLDQGAPLPIGLGFIGWLLDADEAKSKQLFDLALEHNVQALWLAFGVDLPRWLEYIRTAPAYARATHKPLIFVQATSLEEALAAVNEWKVDVVIAQGNEAGGHGGAAAPSTMVFLSELLAALPQEGAPPVLAAGGISNGTQAAAYLTAGAAGVVLGTRFALTPESPYPATNKAAIARARGADTVRTNALDWAWNIYSWPAWINGRGVRTRVVDDIEAGVDHKTVQERHAKAAAADDPGYLVTWCGQGASLVTDSKPAKEVVEELHAGIVHSLQRGNALLG